jgi:hypothetical protein
MRDLIYEMIRGLSGGLIYGLVKTGENCTCLTSKTNSQFVFGACGVALPVQGTAPSAMAVIRLALKCVQVAIA